MSAGNIFLIPSLHLSAFPLDVNSSRFTALQQCSGGGKESIRNGWEVDMKAESWDVFMLRKSSIYPDFPVGAPQHGEGGEVSVWLKGQRVGEDRNGGRKKEGREVGKKSVRKK